MMVRQMNIWLLLMVGVVGAASGVDAQVTDSIRMDWAFIDAQLNRNSYYLLTLSSDSALSIVHHAIRTRDEGVAWAAYGSTVCRAEERAGRFVGSESVLRSQNAVACLQELLGVIEDAAAGASAKRSAEATVLEALAESALDADDLELADATAARLLAQYMEVEAWQWGNVLHNANQMRGRVALRRGAIDRAADHLFAAGATSGSPQLSSFGPRMPLARELVERGEGTVVLEYLAMVRRFWRHPDAVAELDAAATEIREGRVPVGPRWR